jgi:hypothetical protein
VPASAARATVDSCGRVTGGTFVSGTTIDPFTQYSYRVYASRTGCSKARAVARGWGKATNIDGGAPLDATVKGFACIRRSYSQVRPVARCTRGSAVVTLEHAPAVPTIVNFTQFEIRPTVISEGASNSLFSLRWSSWGGSTASATGRESEGVTGHYKTHRLALQAFDIGTCQGIRAYTRLNLLDTDSGRRTIQTLNCTVGQYF